MMLGSKYTLVIRNENNRRHKEKEINTDLVYVHFFFFAAVAGRIVSLQFLLFHAFFGPSFVAAVQLEIYVWYT